HDLDFHLGEKVHDIFGPAIEFGMALLAAEALGLGHGNALQADLLKGLFDLVDLERLYDSLDLFHVSLHVPQAAIPPARMHGLCHDASGIKTPIISVTYSGSFCHSETGT